MPLITPTGDVIVKRKLFPLLWVPSMGHWENTAQVLFKPRGLMIWDAPAGAVVEHCLIGINLEIVATIGPVPARWFSMQQSYDQIAKALDEGAEPPGWNDWRAIDVGQAIRLSIWANGAKVGPDSGMQLVLWGEEHSFTYARAMPAPQSFVDDVDGYEEP